MRLYGLSRHRLRHGVGRTTTVEAKKSSTMIAGRATPAGTKAFIASSNLSLYHKFEKSGLFINPIIHGPPRAKTTGPSTIAEDHLLLHAYTQNKSNCMFVYNCSLDDDKTTGERYWSSSRLDKVLRKREEVVAVAGLGRCASAEVIVNRLEHAHNVCRLESIDAAIIEVDESTFSSNWANFDKFNEAVAVLEELCTAGHLQFYGLSIRLPPYIYHTPALRSTSGLTMIPAFIESTIASGEIPHADLLLYPISPSIAIPTTYPMLDPSPEVWSPELAEEESIESKRTFTRAALDPLLCFKGAAKATTSSVRDILGDGDNVGATKRNFRSNRALDQMGLDPFALKAIGELDREQVTEPPAGDTMDHLGEGEGGPVTSNASSSDSIDAEAETGTPDIVLISGAYPESTEESIRQYLDGMCPALKSTPRLQDKALRAVMSVGIDVTVIDAELSASIGKLALKPSDLISSDETDELFGTFSV